ncbi:LPS-assembly lipoprotein [Pseudaminobacter salicylatoxidans]|uniref:LPS-assembly lipoprotein n=1 Tax=Pseudaminobacter salicylatoxidans TaxID=93369 RepID=A0A316C5B4_PSESE|nr:LPS assembly lipoprotein LptE [Pseudaminobacter salicylatoxidans]PWJ85012.1 LPS-assembly lipoprotein [Pseudaminobacter salicylatoxidans]
MSLPDQTPNPHFRRARGLVLAGLLLSAAAVSACTVRPLYSDPGTGIGAQAGHAEGLNAIAIKPVKTRYAQQVRNNLIFGLNGGAGQPADSLYSLSLSVRSRVTKAAIIQRVTEDEPTAGTLTLTSYYTLTDNKTGKIVATGKREVSSSFDYSRQEYASLRAIRDAEDRAARELAEMLRLALASDLVKHGS